VPTRFRLTATKNHAPKPNSVAESPKFTYFVRNSGDLDSFIPDPEIEEAHETRVEAPAAICLAPRRSSIFSVLPWFG
jgi:hypothetical protein